MAKLAIAGADASAGELATRPNDGAMTEQPRGLQQIDHRGNRAALLYVPATYEPDGPAPVLLMLHGAGGTASHSIGLVERYAERHGIIVVAPTSRAMGWDIISRRRYGEDVRAIDAALSDVFARYAIDAARITIGGFSDGATYALSIGLTNGDLLHHIMAFSPGFMAPTRDLGRPSIFISHGVQDRVLPIEACSRRLVPRLRAAGYNLDYVEFSAGHVVPMAMMDRAFQRFVEGRALAARG